MTKTKTKTKAKTKRAVRGPQMELVRERKLGAADAAFELLPPPPSENQMTALGGAMAVASFRLSADTRGKIDALVAAHVAQTKADVLRVAIDALAKARKVVTK